MCHAELADPPSSLTLSFLSVVACLLLYGMFVVAMILVANALGVVAALRELAPFFKTSGNTSFRRIGSPSQRLAQLRRLRQSRFIEPCSSNRENLSCCSGLCMSIGRGPREDPWNPALLQT